MSTVTLCICEDLDDDTFYTELHCVLCATVVRLTCSAEPGVFLLGENPLL